MDMSVKYLDVSGARCGHSVVSASLGVHFARVLMLAICTSVIHLAAVERSPHIVVFMADDFGYGSSSCYGAEPSLVQTPHIDNLARQGLRFTQAHTPASVCTPTRYAFLTGRYAWRGPLQYGVLNPPEGPLLIEPDLLTLPEYLQKQGYRTAHIGKWHLGYTNLPLVEDLSAQPLSPGPRSMGFDYHFAVPNNLDWLPKVYVENEEIWGLRSPGKNPYGRSSYKDRQYHGYDAPQRKTAEVSREITERASEWIADSVAEHPDKPLFLYFAQVAVHIPIVPSERWAGTSPAGAYGDFIHELDDSVGKITAALEAAGIADETLFIFTSDNGGDFCPEAVEASEAGLAINGPLRGDKHLIYDGGSKVPLIVRWPTHISAGGITERLVNIVDLYATFQEVLTGSVMPADELAPDSFSFAPNLFDPDQTEDQRPTMITNDVVGKVAIRDQQWKYIDGQVLRPMPEKRKAHMSKVELYRIDEDPNEAVNVLEQFPEVAERMQKVLDGIREAGSERLYHEKQHP